MKKLGKLQINPKKVMKNEELLSLRGGYGEGWCGQCMTACDGQMWLCGPACGPSEEWCINTLDQMYHYMCPGDWWVGCADQIGC